MACAFYANGMQIFYLGFLAIMSRFFSSLPFVSSGDIVADLVSAPKASPLLTVDSCLAVGAVWSGQDGDGLTIYDRTYLDHAHYCSSMLGLSWGSNVLIRLANHVADKTQDYIVKKQWFSTDTGHPELTADIVVLCFIPKKGHADRSHHNWRRLVSPNGNSNRDWMRSILQRRPKAVFTVQQTECPAEIIAPEICPQGYSPLPEMPFFLAPKTSLDDRMLRGFVNVGAEIMMHGVMRNDVREAVGRPKLMSLQNAMIEPPHYACL